MNQKNVISLIILDVIVMLLALGLIIFRYSSLSRLSSAQPSPAATLASAVSETEPEEPDAAPAARPAEALPVQKQDTAPVLEKRNIGFTFRNSRPKKVQIIGDFTQWAPRAMAKGANNVWKISIPLAPGEYAYNFIVDGRPIRDPNNGKICDSGRGFPNSYLKVEPKK